MRDRQKSNDLLKAFRESRQQVQQKPVHNSVDNVHNSRSKQRNFTRGYQAKPKDPYSSFLDKYGRLSETIDSFTTQDLMYFFREKAKENAVKYVIANVKRDMAIFKKLQANYSIREICLMIEFIFCSNQNYLDKSVTQPTVLSSSWCNTIYRDSILWANDEYEPAKAKSPTKSERIKKREWQREVTDEKTKIGEWD